MLLYVAVLVVVVAVAWRLLLLIVVYSQSPLFLFDVARYRYWLSLLL